MDLSRASLFSLTIEHLILSVSAAGIAALAGVSLAVFATRKFGQPFMPMVRDAASLAQTIPPAAVLALAIPFLGFGSKPVLFALVLYSILPVLNNTLAALEGLSPSVLETGSWHGSKPVSGSVKDRNTAGPAHNRHRCPDKHSHQCGNIHHRCHSRCRRTGFPHRGRPNPKQPRLGISGSRCVRSAGTIAEPSTQVIGKPSFARWTYTESLEASPHHAVPSIR